MTAPADTRQRTSFYPIIVAVFCGLLLISNVAAVKAIQIGDLTFDGGAILFPLTYVLGDVLAEIYGFGKAKLAIWTGFSLGALASLCFWIVDVLPAPPEYGMSGDFHNVLGFVPGIVLASLAAYLAGQFLNSWVLVKIKQRTKEGKLWARLLGSTYVGQFVDTLVFCFLATTIGPIPSELFWNYFLVGYIFKCAVETVMLPVTYRVIAAIKKREPDYRPA